MRDERQERKYGKVQYFLRQKDVGCSLKNGESSLKSMIQIQKSNEETKTFLEFSIKMRDMFETL